MRKQKKTILQILQQIDIQVLISIGILFLVAAWGERHKNKFHFTSLADYIYSRYGKSKFLAAIATLLCLIGIVPYLGLQIKSVISTFNLMIEHTSLDPITHAVIWSLVINVLMYIFVSRCKELTLQQQENADEFINILEKTKQKELLDKFFYDKKEVEARLSGLVGTASFLSNMSHEIRTPMNAVLGYAQILGQDNTLTHGQRKLVDNIQVAGNHLLSLINDILDLVAIFDKRCQLKGLKLIIENQSGNVSYVKGDELKLKQVLINLIGNAIKFTASGEITIRISNQEEIFNPFYQKQKESSHQQKIDKIQLYSLKLPNGFLEEMLHAAKFNMSTDLQEIINRLEKINAQKYSNFIRYVENNMETFNFKAIAKLLDNIKNNNEGIMQTQINTAGAKILIVDDMPDNIKILEQVLLPYRYHHIIALNGEDALNLAEMNPPQLILLDIMMPEMDGFETCRRLKTNPKTKNIPVIFITGRTDDEDIKLGFQVGGCDYISKPIKKEEVCARIENHLKTHLSMHQLADAKLEMEYILNSTQDGILGLDKNLHVTYINPVALAMVCKPIAEIINAHIKDVFCLFDDKDEINLEQQIIGITVSKKTIKLYRGSSLLNTLGQSFPIEGQVSLLIDHDQKKRGVVITIRDVTEQIAVERALIRAEKMESLRSLSTGVAHEIRNPLSIMMQHSQNIVRRFDKQCAANIEIAKKLGIDIDTVCNYAQERKIPEFVKGIKDAGERVSKIIEFLLHITTIKSEKLAKIQVSSIIDQALSLFKLDTIEIVRNYSTDIPDIACNIDDLTQVFYNIFKNCMDACVNNDRELKIIVNIEHVENQVVIHIQDNGKGMNHDVLKRIFDPFFTTNDVGLGIGLGLTIAYVIIVNGHNGSIEVDSKEDQGTTICVSLPI